MPYISEKTFKKLLYASLDTFDGTNLSHTTLLKKAPKSMNVILSDIFLVIYVELYLSFPENCNCIFLK